MFRIIAVLTVVFLLSLVMFGGDSSPAATGISSVLTECPSLEHGHIDPVDGKKCVLELQKMLGALGYRQPKTGKFAAITEANVKAFQHSNGIRAIGTFGPETRKALLHETSPSEPKVPLPHYDDDHCTSQQCTLVLSRTTTRQYAQLTADRPLTVKAVSAAILRTACAVLKLSFAAIVCQVVTDHYVERVKNALGAAARQHACLRITLTRPDVSTSPLTFVPDNSRRCAQ